MVGLLLATGCASPTLLAVPEGCEPGYEVVVHSQAVGSVFRYLAVCPPGWEPTAKP